MPPRPLGRGQSSSSSVNADSNSTTPPRPPPETASTTRMPDWLQRIQDSLPNQNDGLQQRRSPERRRHARAQPASRDPTASSVRPPNGTQQGSGSNSTNPTQTAPQPLGVSSHDSPISNPGQSAGTSLSRFNRNIGDMRSWFTPNRPPQPLGNAAGMTTPSVALDGNQQYIAGRQGQQSSMMARQSTSSSMTATAGPPRGVGPDSGPGWAIYAEPEEYTDSDEERRDRHLNGYSNGHSNGN